MYLSRVWVKNYRSIEDSGALVFSPGFNLIVGPNNVGKTSFLHCLSGQITGEPHKSLTTVPNRDDIPYPISSIDFSVVASGAELQQLLLKAGSSQRMFPWPKDTDFHQAHMQAVADRLINSPAITFRATASAAAESTLQWSIEDYPATRLYEPLQQPPNQCMLNLEVVTATKRIRPVNPIHAQPRDDFGMSVAQLLVRRIYRFSAERLSLGTSNYGAATELSPDGRNLPELLNILQGNPIRFAEYCELVAEIFPTITKISVRPFPQNPQQAEILVWQTDPRLQRDDLATSLKNCGTGVGQVLAILFVVKASDDSRTIIIDEPSSFLHPGAARKLVGILKRFERHQYIIASHSPEIIAELSDAPVTILKWQDLRTLPTQATNANMLAARALTDVGARLSDVYGYDNIIWVEGQSDASVFKLVLDAAKKHVRGLGIVAVRDTGSFQRRSVAEVLEIYRALSHSNALLPPAILFLFDRDGRALAEIEDMRRVSQNRIRFLPRRMVENYLLDPVSVATVFNELGRDFEIQTTETVIKDWIDKNKARYGEVSDKWLVDVDGAHLLYDLFQELSEARITFRKTRDTPALTKALLARDASLLNELLEALAI